jgi:peptidoglycan/xylan/chitin deacetylase (PgdA/CDA1 family)
MHRFTIAVLVCLTAAACAAPAPGPAPATPAPAAAKVSDSTPPAQTAAPAATPAAKITFSQCHVDGPYVAMTFDDGPHVTNTPRLLDMLKQRNIKATFFVVGQCAAEYPDIMKRIAAEGHEIASHSWSHPDLSKMSEASVHDQLQKTHDTIIRTSGVTPKVMRPPYGAFTARQRAWANGTWGYKCILWDVDPLDWKIRNSEHVKHEILKGTVNGSIILSHDIHKTTVDAMPETLDGLLAKGFKFVTVSELVAMDRPVPPKAKATPAVKVEKSEGGNVPPATPAPKTEKSEAARTPPAAPTPATKP